MSLSFNSLSLVKDIYHVWFFLLFVSEIITRIHIPELYHWEREEIDLLVFLRVRAHPELEQKKSKGFLNIQTIWSDIAEEIKERFGKEVSITTCNNKWKSLKHDFKKYNLQLRGNDEGGVKLFPYVKEFKECFGAMDYEEPSPLDSSEDEPASVLLMDSEQR